MDIFYIISIPCALLLGMFISSILAANGRAEVIQEAAFIRDEVLKLRDDNELLTQINYKLKNEVSILKETARLTEEKYDALNEVHKLFLSNIKKVS